MGADESGNRIEDEDDDEKERQGEARSRVLRFGQRKIVHGFFQFSESFFDGLHVRG